MYDELIQRLRDIARSDGNIKSNYIGLSLLQAADAIEELIAKLNHADEQIEKLVEAAEERCWIPVSERLPKSVCKSYLCLTDTGYHCEVRWTNNVYGLWKSDNNWGWSIADVPQYQKVVAWMPLPYPYEPPKEETE